MQSGDNGSDGLFDSLLNAITSIIEKIVSIPELILDGIKDLFLPQENFLSDTFARLKDKLSSKLGFGTYLELMNALKSQVSNAPNFHGFINTNMWVKYLPQIHAFIKGFFYILIVIFNVKQIIWMIRGSSPIENGRSSAK